MRTPGDRFGGRSLADVNRDPESGWVAVGAQRDCRFRTDEAIDIRPDDAVLVAGTDEMIREFEGERVAS